MSNQQIIMAIIISIIFIIIASHFNYKRKLRNKIKSEWGKIPKESRLDSEKSLIKSYENLKSYYDTDSHIDDITWYDLDLYAIFQDINHTHSSVGSEALYQRLRQFNFDDKVQQRTEDIIHFYENQPDVREKIEFIFAELGKKDNNSVIKYLTTSDKKSIASLALYILLGSLPLIGLVLIILGYDGFGFMLLLGSVVFNIGYSAVKKVEINMELIGMSYLVQTLNTAKRLTKIDHPLNNEIKELLKSFKKAMRFSFAFQARDNSEMNVILDYLNMLFMIPFIAYHYVFNQVKNHEQEALQIWQLLGELEIAYAILNFRMTLPLYTQPVFTEDNDVVAEDVYHPLLATPVPNPVQWTKNTLVSGSNASGKSTYVKSIAINCVLAQTINTCLAAHFSMKRGHVLTSMAVEDDVMMGDSYFIAEIKSLKRVLNKVETNDRCYLFIDEILRGTNTVERIAASASIIHWINDYPSLAFVATHDIELTEILKDEASNVHFKEMVTEAEGVQFDYTLRAGPATSRNAIMLLQTMDFPGNIVQHAQEKANYFDKNQVWLNFKEVVEERVH